MWDYLPTRGWNVFDDKVGYEGSRTTYRLEFDYTDAGSGEPRTLHYWIEAESTTGYELYGDVNKDGTYTAYDQLVTDTAWGSGDLTVWTSDDPGAQKSIIITLGKKVAFGWIGWEEAWIPNADTSGGGYPMALSAANNGCYWYGPPIENAFATEYAYICPSNYPSGTSFPSVAFNGYKPFLAQGFGLSCIEYNYQYPIAEFTFINSPDILMEYNLSRNGNRKLVPATAMGMKFDGINYYLTLHDGTGTCGANIWLPVGTQEPKLVHEGDPA